MTPKPVLVVPICVVSSSLGSRRFWESRLSYTSGTAHGDSATHLPPIHAPRLWPASQSHPCDHIHLRQNLKSSPTTLPRSSP